MRGAAPRRRWTATAARSVVVGAFVLLFWLPGFAAAALSFVNDAPNRGVWATFLVVFGAGLACSTRYGLAAPAGFDADAVWVRSWFRVRVRSFSEIVRIEERRTSGLRYRRHRLTLVGPPGIPPFVIDLIPLARGGEFAAELAARTGLPVERG